jgi:hypothetical protein
MDADGTEKICRFGFCHDADFDNATFPFATKA